MTATHTSAPAVEPGLCACLSVTDTGIGLDGETQARVFEPFFTTKGPGVGTGLGLSTVHGIIAQLGGHVEIYSDLGLGSSVKVYSLAVAADAPQRAYAPPARPTQPTGNEHILVRKTRDYACRVRRERLHEPFPPKRSTLTADRANRSRRPSRGRGSLPWRGRG
jgi:hypothetical protein